MAGRCGLFTELYALGLQVGVGQRPSPLNSTQNDSSAATRRETRSDEASSRSNAARYDHGPGKEDTGPRSGPIGSSGGLLRAPRHVDRVNIQRGKDAHAKAYQVRQVLDAIAKLEAENNEEDEESDDDA